jgi:hypothetical protein
MSCVALEEAELVVLLVHGLDRFRLLVHGLAWFRLRHAASTSIRRARAAS